MNSPGSSRFWCIQNLDAFRTLTAGETERLLEGGERRTIGPNGIHPSEGSLPISLALVKEGEVNGVVLDEIGNGETLGILGPGDLFGEYLATQPASAADPSDFESAGDAAEIARGAGDESDEDSSPTEMRAETPVEIVVFDPALFESKLRTFPHLAPSIRRLTRFRLETLEMPLPGLLFRRPAARVAAVLLQMARQNSVRVGRSDLARLGGMLRDLFDHEIRLFEQRGIVLSRWRGIDLIDRSALEKAAADRVVPVAGIAGRPSHPECVISATKAPLPPPDSSQGSE